MTTRCRGCDSHAGLCDSNTLFSVGCLVEFFPKCIYIINVKIGHGKIQPVLLKRDIVGLPATGGGQGATTRADISPAAALSHQGRSQSCCLFVLPRIPPCFPSSPKMVSVGCSGRTQASAVPLTGGAVRRVWHPGLGPPEMGSQAAASPRLAAPCPAAARGGQGCLASGHEFK